ncbi:hypothetical protein [Aeoliella mucimassa]|uniref:Uncharacterized protein n=1 Tax=Aeoliella mucimassa TaxID=2527972 RepID=A0A518ATT4_9BACT|nr:hypothetical protein [Aeoliella mucimassa]QDU58142.1 hypothetical protein Pan181_43690 [Aeoliella mucimassa]
MWGGLDWLLILFLGVCRLLGLAPPEQSERENIIQNILAVLVLVVVVSSVLAVIGTLVLK